MNILFSILKFPILVFIVNVIFDKTGVYVTLLWSDMPMHFLGGASIAVAGIGFLSLLRKHAFMSALPFPVWVFLIMSFVGLAAASWELWEFSIDFVLKKNLQRDLFDTMTDMFFGLLGGFITSIAWLFLKGKSSF